MNSLGLTAGAVGTIFALGGAALGGLASAVAAFIVGAAIGAGLHAVGLRQLVILATTGAAVVGAVIGKTVVDALCLPGTCTPLSWLAAALMAVGTLIGVGVVVALATRSFEEHRIATGQQPPPPEADAEA